MKLLSVSVVTLCMSIFPSFVWAIVDVPQYYCYATRSKQISFWCDTNFPSKQSDPIGAHQKAQLDNFQAELLKKTPKVYTVVEINNLLNEKDQTILQLKKDLEAELKNVKAKVPKDIGKTVEKVVKANLQDVLRNLLMADPEFKKTVADMLKQK